MYVYILLCADDSYYVGVTNSIERRIKEHKSALHPDSYTAQRLPVELKWYGVYDGPLAAIAWEKRIKRWSRAKKEALINGDIDAIQRASKKNFER